MIIEQTVATDPAGYSDSATRSLPALPTAGCRRSAAERFRVRGTTREGDRVRLSLNWALAWWSDFVVAESALVWRGRAIPYAEIEDAELVSVPVPYGGTQKRLIVRTQDEVYQFVLPFASLWSWNPEAETFWDGPLPFPVRRVERELDTSLALLLLVLWVGVGVAYWALVFVRG